MKVFFLLSYESSIEAVLGQARSLLLVHCVQLYMLVALDPYLDGKMLIPQKYAFRKYS